VTLAAPEPIAAHHSVASFDCGKASLNSWLARRALANQASGASRTYVVSDHERVVAYYALASSAVASGEATGRLRRNMPDPIPVVVLGRLAVDRKYQRQAIGRALLQDAARRVVHAADVIGIRGLLVHAIDNDARAFYQRLGFDPSPLDSMTLMISLGDIQAGLKT